MKRGEKRGPTASSVAVYFVRKYGLLPALSVSPVWNCTTGSRTTPKAHVAGAESEEETLPKSVDNANTGVWLYTPNAYRQREWYEEEEEEERDTKGVRR